MTIVDAIAQARSALQVSSEVTERMSDENRVPDNIRPLLKQDVYRDQEAFEILTQLQTGFALAVQPPDYPGHVLVRVVHPIKS